MSDAFWNSDMLARVRAVQFRIYGVSWFAITLAMKGGLLVAPQWILLLAIGLLSYLGV